MCGIFAVFNEAGLSLTASEYEISVDALAHRGPDDRGSVHDKRVFLGHRRLSIIDTSVLGRQPMSSDDGDVDLVYNGQLYNFRGLRAELEANGLRFRTECDTEVFLKDGELNVVYFDGKTNDMKLASLEEGSWSAQTIAGEDHAVGFHNEVVQDLNGNWWAASYDYTNRKIFTRWLVD